MITVTRNVVLKKYLSVLWRVRLMPPPPLYHNRFTAFQKQKDSMAVTGNIQRFK